MNNARWKSILSLAIALLVGVALGITIRFSNIEAQAQPEGLKKVKLVKTAIVEAPDATLSLERWEDLDYKVVCYIGGMAISCMKK
jgi:hypothetical protein